MCSAMKSFKRRREIVESIPKDTPYCLKKHYEETGRFSFGHEYVSVQDMQKADPSMIRDQLKEALN